MGYLWQSTERLKDLNSGIFSAEADLDLFKVLQILPLHFWYFEK